MKLQNPLATVTPTTDGDVLTRLALISTPLSLPDLTRLVPTRSYHGVRNTVARLVGQGTVREIGHGRTRLYELNREHVAAEPIIALANSGRLVQERIVGLVSKWVPCPSIVVLYGPGARGEMSDTSDLDLLIVRPEGVAEVQWREQLDDLAARVHMWSGNDAQIVDYLKSEIADLGGPIPFLENILREGAFLVGSRADFRRMMGVG